MDRYKILKCMLEQLPYSTGRWTKAERARWLAGFTACLDYLTTTVESEVDQPT